MAERPNVLLLVLDAVRSDHLSCYGYNRQTTPNIDQIANKNILYRNAFSPSVWTPSVHGSIFTGKYPSHVGIYGNSLKIPESEKTITELLNESGYKTFVASAGAHIIKERGYGRGVDEYVESRKLSLDFNTIAKLLTDTSYTKQAIFSLTSGPDDKTVYKFSKLKKFIRETDTDNKPFFGFVNCKTAHSPYNPPRPFKKEFTEGLERPRCEFIERIINKLGMNAQDVSGHDIEKLRGDLLGVISDDIKMTDEEWDIIKGWYDGAIRYVDKRVGELIEYLKKINEFENTLIIITSDHGDNFGDHGMASHTHCLYDSILRVPLIISPPKQYKKSQDIKNQVTLVDLYPTIAEVASVGETNDYPYTESLLPFKDEKIHEHTFAEHAVYRGTVNRLERKFSFKKGDLPESFQSVRDNKYKLILDSKGGEELYDWKRDAQEHEDISKEFPDTVSRLKSILSSSLGKLDRDDQSPEHKRKEVEEKLEDLGYL